MRTDKLDCKRVLYLAVCFLATLQFVWCYLQLVHPYLKTMDYEWGRAKMPFQGRMLMMFVLRFAHRFSPLTWTLHHAPRLKFWFDFGVTPEAIVEAAANVAGVLLAGWLTIKIYEAASRRQLLTLLIYPLFLVLCTATYIMHTTQNLRFVYDIPNMAFFAAGMYLIYFRKHWAWFAALFLVATVNRETSLFLLVLYTLDRAVEGGRLRWRLLVRPGTLAVVVPLGLAWAGWQLYVHHLFAANVNDMYPRLNWNLKSLALPLAWPQMLSAGGYLPLFVAVMYRRIPGVRLRAWLWVLPVWLVFMFFYGVLIETRIFGEMIPLIAICSALIVEELLVERMEIELEPALAVSTTLTVAARESDLYDAA
jgi:hypothetical protein